MAALVAACQREKATRVLPMTHIPRTPTSSGSPAADVLELAAYIAHTACSIRADSVLWREQTLAAFKAIGRQLFISERTVAQHLTAIFNKLGVDTRAQAVAVVTQRGRL